MFFENYGHPHIKPSESKSRTLSLYNRKKSVRLLLISSSFHLFNSRLIDKNAVIHIIADNRHSNARIKLLISIGGVNYGFNHS